MLSVRLRGDQVPRPLASKVRRYISPNPTRPCASRLDVMPGTRFDFVMAPANQSALRLAMRPRGITLKFSAPGWLQFGTEEGFCE